MTITIYRKRQVLNSYVIDEKPETTFSNVQNLEITGKYIYGNIGGEQLTIAIDNYNYKYFID